MTKEKLLKNTTILIDWSSLKVMFEGKNKEHSNDLLNKMKEMNDKGVKLHILTTQASLLRAIFLADPKTNINKIQKALTFLKVYPSLANYKNEDEVRNEIIEFAKTMSKLGGKKN